MENKVNSFIDWNKLSPLDRKNYFQEPIYNQPVIFGLRKYLILFMISRRNAFAFCLIFMTGPWKIMRKFSKWAKVSTSLFATTATLKKGIYLLLIQWLFSLAIHRSLSKNWNGRYWVHVTRLNISTKMISQVFQSKNVQ